MICPHCRRPVKFFNFRRSNLLKKVLPGAARATVYVLHRGHKLAFAFSHPHVLPRSAKVLRDTMNGGGVSFGGETAATAFSYRGQTYGASLFGGSPLSFGRPKIKVYACSKHKDGAAHSPQVRRLALDSASASLVG